MAQIILNIPDNVVTEYLADVVRAAPIPTDEDGTNLFTPGQWVKQLLKQHLR